MTSTQMFALILPWLHTPVSDAVALAIALPILLLLLGLPKWMSSRRPDRRRVTGR